MVENDLHGQLDDMINAPQPWEAHKANGLLLVRRCNYGEGGDIVVQDAYSSSTSWFTLAILRVRVKFVVVGVSYHIMIFELKPTTRPIASHTAY